MASPDNQELIKKLQKKLNQTEKESQQTAISEEVSRCQSLSLKGLGAEILEKGRHQGMTCQEIYDKHLSYVIWVMQHQAGNLALIRLIEYAKKIEGAPVPSKGKMEKSTKTESVPLDGTLQALGSESDWEEMTPVPPQASPSETLHMFQAMMGAFNELKIRMDDLHRSNEQQQMSLHQGLGIISQVQVNQETQERRLSQMESHLQQPGK